MNRLYMIGYSVANRYNPCDYLGNNKIRTLPRKRF